FLTEHRNDSAALRNFPPASRDSDYWRGVPTVVCDGGEYYFGVEFDPGAHRFRNFSFDGRYSASPRVLVGSSHHARSACRLPTCFTLRTVLQVSATYSLS